MAASDVLRHTPAPFLALLPGVVRRDCLAYFAAAAAAAFLVALAAVDALRRRLVLGGVAGASPISSATKMLVTKSLGPWSSKSIAVRSGSEAVTMPSPYCSCLMVCPSCITCTTSSLDRARYFRNPFVFSKVRGSRPLESLSHLYRLEACDILCLKALRALLYFEFHRLAFIQGLVPIHLNGGEVDENIFPGLALDEPEALRSVEPLHCSLFLHCTTSMLKLLCLSWSRGLVSQAPRQPPARQKKAAMCCRSPLNESKGNTRATNAIRKPITGKGLLSRGELDTPFAPAIGNSLIFRVLGYWGGLQARLEKAGYSSKDSGWRLA